MATENLAIAANGDDACQSIGGSLNPVGTALVAIASDTSDAIRIHGGFRFVPAAGTQLYPKSKVTTATLQLFTTTFADINADIHGDAQDNCPAFAAGANDVVSRTRTTASVAWVQDGLTLGAYAAPSSIHAAPNEVLIRPGYVRANALGVLGWARSDVDKLYGAQAFEAAGTSHALLDLTFQPPRHRQSPMNGIGAAGAFFAHPLS